MLKSILKVRAKAKTINDNNLINFKGMTAKNTLIAPL